ncbi:MAG: hypothetical protein R2712_23730 [Vicinamibacterales bacterium]
MLAPLLLDAVVAASLVALPIYVSVHVDRLALLVAVRWRGAGLIASLAPAWSSAASSLARCSGARVAARVADRGSTGGA